MARPDPRKLKDEAQEAVAKGKWKKALEAYLALEKLEPKDGAWPQRAGEMSRRLGKKEDAVAALARAAEVFSASGFLLKAVAVCKIILAIEPGHTATQSKLAALHAQRNVGPGLVPPIVRSPPPPPPMALPRRTTLDEVSLGKVMPGARRSNEIEAVGDAGAYEIPLEDVDLSAVTEAVESEATMEVGGEILADAVVPTPDAEAAAAVLPRTPLFSSLDERRLRALIERVRLIQLEPGAAVFEQGDPGDALYVVASGEVAVQVGPAADVTEVARLGEGAFFGEIALVARQPRNATVRATVATDLLAIDRDVLFELIEDEPAVLKVILRFLRDRLLDRLVDTSPLFRPFTGEEREAVAARFRFIEAERDAQLLEQGKRAPGLFVLLSGQARVLHDGTEINTLASGDIFGEMSLLMHQPAIATIRASAKCYLLELPRGDFAELIMTHPQVLEYMSRVAEDRQRHLEAVKSGATRYGEGRVRIV
jgi:CRP-like cAMP-binding protein